MANLNFPIGIHFSRNKSIVQASLMYQCQLALAAIISHRLMQAHIGLSQLIVESDIITYFIKLFDAGLQCEFIPISMFTGIYRLVPHAIKQGFLAPVYKKEGNPNQYLYSHHHEGRLWLLGQSYTSWSIRLDLVTPFKVCNMYVKGLVTILINFCVYSPYQQQLRVKLSEHRNF